MSLKYKNIPELPFSRNQTNYIKPYLIEKDSFPTPSEPSEHNGTRFCTFEQANCKWKHFQIINSVGTIFQSSLHCLVQMNCKCAIETLNVLERSFTQKTCTHKKDNPLYFPYLLVVQN